MTFSTVIPSTNFFLNRAQTDDNDEIYTTMGSIAAELPYYKEELKGKIVYCNCNDVPGYSQFPDYLAAFFNEFGLRGLMASSYEPCDHGHLYVYQPSTKQWITIQMRGTGDFGSRECRFLLKYADIVITSPTRKNFQEYMRTLFEYNKKFLLIGNINVVTYSYIFPLFRMHKIWFGYTFPKRFYDASKEKLVSYGNMVWYTNLSVFRKSTFVARSSYSAGRLFGKYPKMDGFNAIYVETVRDIPYDYAGLMAVPITYLLVHNPEHFDIIGEANHGSDDPLDLFVPKLNGKLVFKRIIICRRKPI